MLQWGTSTTAAQKGPRASVSPAFGRTEQHLGRAEHSQQDALLARSWGGGGGVSPALGDRPHKCPLRSLSAMHIYLSFFGLMAVVTRFMYFFNGLRFCFQSSQSEKSTFPHLWLFQCLRVWGKSGAVSLADKTTLTNTGQSPWHANRCPVSRLELGQDFRRRLRMHTVRKCIETHLGSLPALVPNPTR